MDQSQYLHIHDAYWHKEWKRMHSLYLVQSLSYFRVTKPCLHALQTFQYDHVRKQIQIWLLKLLKRLEIQATRLGLLFCFTVLIQFIQ